MFDNLFYCIVGMSKRQSSHHLQRTHTFHLSFAFVTDPFRPTPKPYTPICRLQPDSNGEFPLNLEAEIEPIPCRATTFLPQAFTDEQKAVIEWGYSAYDFSLSHHVNGFLEDDIYGNVDSVRSFLSRNIHFLDIIRIIAAKGTEYAAMNITRDHNTLSSRTRVGAAIYEKGYPELVIVEEQAAGGADAERELCDNFVFLPHYARLTRVVGIAIVGDQFKIGFIYRDSKRFEVLMDLTAGQDGNGYTLVRAAVNIGLWFRATMNRGVLEHLPFRFGVPLVSAHRRLRIFMTKFQKVLLPHDDIDLEALSQFYESIRSQRIPYFEYPVDDEGETDNVDDIFYDGVARGEVLDLVLEPVGLARQPRTSGELTNCLLCILTALRDLHGRGYVHLDLRWPNVIIVAQGSWYIIGGDYVRKTGDPYPQNIRIRDGDVVDSAVDFTMLGMMLGALENPRLITSNVQTLIEYLTTGERSSRTAEGALQLVQGW